MFTSQERLKTFHLPKVLGCLYTATVVEVCALRRDRVAGGSTAAAPQSPPLVAEWLWAVEIKVSLLVLL